MYINRDDINLAEGVHFVQDLIGLEVKDAGNGRVYGKNFRCFAYRRKRCLRNQRRRRQDIPCSSNLTMLVKEINVNDGYVLIVPMKGIFDDED